jgi:hypothetical protein
MLVVMLDWADAATVPVIQISKQIVGVFIFKLLHALSSHAAHWANTVVRTSFRAVHGTRIAMRTIPESSAHGTLDAQDSRHFESVTEKLTAAKTISGTPPPESPFRAPMETAMTKTLVLVLLFATLANAICLVGRF